MYSIIKLDFNHVFNYIVIFDLLWFVYIWNVNNSIVYIPIIFIAQKKKELKKSLTYYVQK